MFARVHPFRCKQGQASVFVLALIGVVLVAFVFLYQAGRLTSEKMQLQNGVDAAAFGASTLEARSLNFCAYTNRAMVANEVAIGQLVGLLSMVDEGKSFGEYLQAYGEAIEIATAWLFALVGVGDVIEGVITAIVEVLIDVGEGIVEVFETFSDAVLKPVLDIVTPGLSINNEIYSLSQTIYHGATMVLVTENTFQSLQDNTYGTSFDFSDLLKGDQAGVQISDVGLLALALHMPSYWSSYTKRYAPQSEKKSDAKKSVKTSRKSTTGKKKKDKKESTKKENEGLERLAAVIREARDPYTSGGQPIKERNFLGMEVEYKNRAWFLGLELDERIHFNAEIFSIDVRLSESFGVRSKGGSELMSKGGNYAWIGLDTLIGGPVFSYDIKGKVFGFSKHWKHTFGTDIGLPLGGGIGQAAEKAGGSNALTPVDIDTPNPLNFYSKSFTPFGGAGAEERMVMVETASVDLEENTVAGYSGLKAYRDRPVDEAKEDPDSPPVLPFQSPFFLIGAIRDMGDITETGPQFSGKLDLINDKDNPIQPQLSAVAKSQVYFARPHKKDDLASYFFRADGKEEKSNVFSPFWQARLVKTTDLDRLMVLALQDHVIWLPGQLEKDIPGLEKVISFLENVFDTLSKVLDPFIKFIQGLLSIF